jgi:imidazolonepropionase-like amidohydrolase
MSRFGRLGGGLIADGRDEVLTAVRENLRFGASQIKLMAGGGTSSDYDPLDLTQYTHDEMRAAVDWGTYVTVHAYHERSVRRAIEGGVKCIGHGQLLDEATLGLVAERGVWLSRQTLMADSPDTTEARRQKRRPVIEGQERVWPLAKRLGVKLAWGTDFPFEPGLPAGPSSVRERAAATAQNRDESVALEGASRPNASAAGPARRRAGPLA